MGRIMASHVHAQGFGRDVAPGGRRAWVDRKPLARERLGRHLSLRGQPVARTYGEAIGLDPDLL